MNDVLHTAKSCRHYAMCNLDFLGTGLCKSGAEKHYVSFYPQGRMDLYAALAENRIPVTSAHFNNVYEESRAHAENMVTGICREDDLPYTILRPSIVYGDSVTGRSLRFNALHYPVRALLYIRDIYLDDLQNNSGTKSAECGIYINENGALHLPIRIFIPNDGRINLIPVDYFTEPALSILENPVTETFYHITGNNPESMVRLAAYAERFLKISGIEIVIGTSGAEEMRNPPEELFDYFIKAYRPYISDK